MIGKDRILSLLESAIAKSPAEQTEMVYIGSSSNLTRFANSVIHQNVSETNSRIYIRTIFGKKVGVASTNSLVKGDVQKALSASCEIARNQKDNPDVGPLPSRAKYRRLSTYFKATAEYSPAQRAERVAKIAKAAARHDLTVAGSFATSESEMAVVNSNGVRAYQPLTSAGINLIAMSDTSSGYAEGLARNVNKIDFREVQETAIEKAVTGKSPRDIKAGRYDVVLEPCAVGTLMEWLVYIGFGSKAMQEGTSFLSGRIGKKIMGDNFTVYDDATDSSGIAFPFDFEGVPKRRVYLVKKGVGVGGVHNTWSANRAGTRSTGHALTPDVSEGAFPLNVFIAGGRNTLSSMIGSVKRGLLVTRFHYINGFLDTRKALMTGMTRDGTFLIKDGKIRHGVKNLRFTDSMVRAFSNIEMLSREKKLVTAWWDDIGCTVAPAMLIKGFRFSGTTEF